MVGYGGPIVDALSTRAEEALYQAIAEGLPTRDAVRQARAALARPLGEGEPRHRPGEPAPTRGARAAPAAGADPFPFAWAQLVFYRRGPEWPLSIPAPAGRPPIEEQPQRRFRGPGNRRVLSAGFIGRRPEQHGIRRRLRRGERVLVIQGLGGLGKSTLAQQVLPWLSPDGVGVCTLWCQETVGHRDPAEALVGQLLEWCRGRFGHDWEPVVQQVDRVADPARRFLAFLQVAIDNAPGLVLYLDNLESLLIGPAAVPPMGAGAGDPEDPDAFADWAGPALATLWRETARLAQESGRLHLLASCRYRNPDLAPATLPLGPLPPDALYRLTGWHPALARLHPETRARLAGRLAGHPRAVDYAADLVADALACWCDRHGDWALPVPPGAADLEREWTRLVEPALPRVAALLQDDLLLRAIWERVLDDPARRFLYRMTALRRPADWDLLQRLGDPQAPTEAVEATAQRLRATSLLEQEESRVRRPGGGTDRVLRFALHPATLAFVTAAYPPDPPLLRAVHRRLGDYLEAQAQDSPVLEVRIEAGHHLFDAGEFDRAEGLLGPAAQWLQEHGRVREGLAVLAPFLDLAVQAGMDRGRVGRILGTIGSAHRLLAEVEKAIGYYEQALVIHREIGDRRVEGAALGSLGLAYARLGEVEKARSLLQQAQSIGEQIRDPQMVRAATAALAALPPPAQ
ncbi:tetratricopeptide repeat protein [uncultured Thiodictyon sp.]|uniref:tetratricopeptide repeat protein n=1 Tax=uncultured Thiodictyon sp. TaxID=1846217 RepID=UPI0025DA85D1|nr:tetratricopeptide repeat protein [uncultured Thiodictyon sp.]